MGPTGGRHRVLQVHPTRRCNLRCLHCYSLSGPEQKEELDATLLKDALTDASKQGFNVAGFSGGEPLLYGPLRELLEHGHRCGMITTVTTNGMLLDERRLATLCGAVDLLAISLDGVPASHNRMRASDRAFGTMMGRLDSVRRSGIRFGFIFTLTQYNVHELQWVAQFASDQGASLLQIHPLEEVGRARIDLQGERPDALEATHAFLQALRIQSEMGNRLQVHLDLMDRELARTEPERVFATQLSRAALQGPFASLVSPLVVEPDGVVVPVQYGFARTYMLGDLHDRPLYELMERWRADKIFAFRELCLRVFEELQASADLPFVNWYELVTEESRRTPLSVAAAATGHRQNRR